MFIVVNRFIGKTDEEGLIKEPFNISYCKDCGVKMEEVEKYDDDVINEENGEVITTNNHPCNTNSPLYS